LPFCFFTIKVEREAFKAFIINKKGAIPHPVTLGEHLRNRRLALNLRQEDVARPLGTLREVYDRWERDKRVPVVSEWPGILSFLGGYPFSQETAADLVLKARRCQGMDQKHLANSLGVIHQRLRRWEHGAEIPDEGILLRLARLALLPSAMLLTESPTQNRYCVTPKKAPVI
jgi:transcriptional regulator with XRE-family HTH domain